MFGERKLPRVQESFPAKQPFLKGKFRESRNKQNKIKENLTELSTYVQ